MINQLAEIIAERITLQTQRPDSLELGEIQPDLSLKIDRFAIPIPKGEYMIAEWTARVTLPPFSLVGRGESPVTNDGTPIPLTGWTQQTRWDWHSRTIPDVKIEIKPELQAGDRVLVGWVNNNIDPIVISKVVTS